VDYSVSAPTIDGVDLTPLRQLVDERGAVLHMLRADAPEFVAFGECYFSEVKPGVIKGWKRHRRQTQNVAVPVGRARFVIYDERERSPTRGRIDIIELGRPDAYARLRIPPMLWYAFTCISSGATLIANCVDVPHDPAESDTVALAALGEGRIGESLRQAGR
jgi:dTDP-4-dehydrorhamnose 3,5-epimerase